MKTKGMAKAPVQLSRIFLIIALLATVIVALFLRGSKINQLSRAQAQSTTAESKKAASAWGGLKELQESLKKREAKIKKKEQQVEQKEKRLAAVKKEIIQRIETLKALKKELEEKYKQLDARQEKRLKDLSKIFEGTPPVKAGSIIAQTDLSTAAEIIMRMDKRKAGQLWGYINPKLAAQITKNIIQKNALGKNRSGRR